MNRALHLSIAALVLVAAIAHAGSSFSLDDTPGDPYPLDTCAACDTKLADVDKPVLHDHDGRESRLCSTDCAARFADDPAPRLARIDERIIEAQRPYYPLTTCIVSGRSLAEDGEDTGIDVVVRNRLFRLCCRGCTGRLEGDLPKHFATLNEAVAEAQRPRYPLRTCAVAGQNELGSMGAPDEIVVANRLVRFCCAGCRGSFRRTPAKYLARVDGAWEPRLEAGIDWSAPVPARPDPGTERTPSTESR